MGYGLYSVPPSDKFADLGIVGATGINGNALDLFSLSCRALWCNIEEIMIDFIRENNITRIYTTSTHQNFDLCSKLNGLLKQWIYQYICNEVICSVVTTRVLLANLLRRFAFGIRCVEFRSVIFCSISASAALAVECLTPSPLKLFPNWMPSIPSSERIPPQRTLSQSRTTHFFVTHWQIKYCLWTSLATSRNSSLEYGVFHQYLLLLSNDCSTPSLAIIGLKST